MNTRELDEILSLFDQERRTIVYPGVRRFSDNEIVRDVSEDRQRCEIVYSSCSDKNVGQVILHQIETARRSPYELEWKVYGHDQPHDLGDHLTAAGFEAGDREAFMVFVASEEGLSRFGVGQSDIRQVTATEGLDDVRTIIEEVRGKSGDREIEQYRSMLTKYPDTMSLYVAYVSGEPASCGRVYFHKESQFAGLYGGQTRERFRKRGLFTDVVATRIREAVSRGIPYICVDALPTSEPILAKRGFERLTFTQPYRFTK